MDFRLNPAISAACAAVKRLFTIDGRCFSIKNMDEKSDGHVVEKQLKCAVSSCLDMGSICCKECSIRNCRYKCDYVDKEICNHQLFDYDNKRRF
ncbi:MAG: hypothetical protein GX301_09980 [Gracilibacteraceae bacterium]|nr:hypothetical protein [Gracilibacteraceae bacterium]